MSTATTEGTQLRGGLGPWAWKDSHGNMREEQTAAHGGDGSKSADGIIPGLSHV